jgi:hypothetical protein
VDGGKWSEKALFDAFTLSKGGDEIIVMHVTTPGHDAKAYYEG